MSSGNRSRTDSHRSFRLKFLPLVLGILVLILGIWLTNRFLPRADEQDQSGILMHLRSMVGESAPPFTLTDSDGVAHTVTPGEGRPTALVFHMGTR